MPEGSVSMRVQLARVIGVIALSTLASCDGGANSTTIVPLRAAAAVVVEAAAVLQASPATPTWVRSLAPPRSSSTSTPTAPTHRGGSATSCTCPIAARLVPSRFPRGDALVRRSATGRRGRAVEGSSLENCRGGNPSVSSNLTVSANRHSLPHFTPLQASPCSERQHRRTK